MDSREIVESVFSSAFKIVLVVVAAMFIYKYAVVAYDYGYRIFSEQPMTSGEGRKVEVPITEDMDVKEIGQVLENKGLIRDANLFRMQERLSENHGKIKPGLYELSTSMTAEEMIAVMSESASDSEESGEEVSPANAPIASDVMAEPMNEPVDEGTGEGYEESPEGTEGEQ